MSVTSWQKKYCSAGSARDDGVTMVHVPRDILEQLAECLRDDNRLVINGERFLSGAELKIYRGWLGKRQYWWWSLSAPPDEPNPFPKDEFPMSPDNGPQWIHGGHETRAGCIAEATQALGRFYGRINVSLFRAFCSSAGRPSKFVSGHAGENGEKYV